MGGNRAGAVNLPDVFSLVVLLASCSHLLSWIKTYPYSYYHKLTGVSRTVVEFIFLFSITSDFIRLQMTINGLQEKIAVAEKTWKRFLKYKTVKLLRIKIKKEKIKWKSNSGFWAYRNVRSCYALFFWLYSEDLV